MAPPTIRDMRSYLKFDHYKMLAVNLAERLEERALLMMPTKQRSLPDARKKAYDDANTEAAEYYSKYLQLNMDVSHVTVHEFRYFKSRKVDERILWPPQEAFLVSWLQLYHKIIKPVKLSPTLNFWDKAQAKWDAEDTLDVDEIPQDEETAFELIDDTITSIEELNFTFSNEDRQIIKDMKQAARGVFNMKCEWAQNHLFNRTEKASQVLGQWKKPEDGSEDPTFRLFYDKIEKESPDEDGPATNEGQASTGSDKRNLPGESESDTEQEPAKKLKATGKEPESSEVSVEEPAWYTFSEGTDDESEEE
ncbi:hypothetical protein QBC40DRAFT_295319 [Triangularia verruculosa]|uniref:Uncharacterized protein n=1 Tax=Triangularia verruculosa TaxID=2587418 RepID=A0AAN6XJV7_9PEZI|nr:hypothetical protein QBC40DRAFT_295319 [Triangularia verruculosa]